MYVAHGRPRNRQKRYIPVLGRIVESNLLRIKEKEWRSAGSQT
jgi:hypothetical protein